METFFPPQSQNSSFFYYQKRRARVTDLSYFYRHHSLFWLLYRGTKEKEFDVLLNLTHETWFKRVIEKFFLLLFFQPTVTMNLDTKNTHFFHVKIEIFKITICEMDWIDIVTIFMLFISQFFLLIFFEEGKKSNLKTSFTSQLHSTLKVYWKKRIKEK